MKKTILILMFTLVSASLFAQLSGASSAKNIMNKGGGRAAKATKLTVKLTADGYYQTGNIEKITASGSLSMALIDSIKEFSVNGRAVYGQNNKVTNQREYIAGAQFDYHPFAVVSPFTRFEFYKNPFKKIKERYAGLLGMKYRYLTRPGLLDYSISAALSYDIEFYEPVTYKVENQPDSIVIPPEKERLRASIRPKFKQYITQNVYLITEVYYKPNLKYLNDYILCGNASLNIRVAKWGLLKVSYEHEYNNKPVNKVKQTDALLLVGIEINL